MTGADTHFSPTREDRSSLGLGRRVRDHVPRQRPVPVRRRLRDQGAAPRPAAQGAGGDRAGGTDDHHEPVLAPGVPRRRVHHNDRDPRSGTRSHSSTASSTRTWWTTTGSGSPPAWASGGSTNSPSNTSTASAADPLS